MNREQKVTLSLDIIEQMFCEEEGILSKFTEITPDTITEWLEEKEYLNEEDNENDWNIVYAEEGADFQEYVRSNGAKVKTGQSPLPGGRGLSREVRE